VRHGGQNPIEAAKLGTAILHGPHVWNFADIYSALDAARGAEEVDDAEKLAARIGALLSDARLRATVAAAALKTVETLGGALDRTLTAIDPYLMQLRLEYREAHGRAVGLVAAARICLGVAPHRCAAVRGC